MTYKKSRNVYNWSVLFFVLVANAHEKSHAFPLKRKKRGLKLKRGYQLFIKLSLLAYDPYLYYRSLPLSFLTRTLLVVVLSI